MAGAKDTTVLRDLEILLDRGVLKAIGKGYIFDLTVRGDDEIADELSEASSVAH